MPDTIIRRSGRSILPLLAASLGAAAGLASGAWASAPASAPAGASAASPSPDRLKAPLPAHPEVVTGTLENGLTYMVKRHSNPPGKVYLNLHIASGSTNETEQQRGIAHYLEHMAFNGSANFAPGTLIPAFEHMGLTFGRHQNASTSFDATNYILDLPKTDAETIGKGLLFFADVAGRLSLLDNEIEEERQIILEEKRARLSAEQRIFDQMLPAMLPGSLVSRRLPIGVEETILGVKRQDFVDYYAKWYVPANMTLIVVGDADPAMIVDLIRKNFAELRKAPRPTPQSPGVAPSSAQRAIVATDAELTRGSVQMMILSDREPPSRSVGDLRDDLTDTIGSWAFGRRVRAKVDAGAMKFRGASASVTDYLSAARMASVDAIGEPQDWRAMIRDLAAELQRARQFGFSEREVEDARKELLSGAANNAKRESTFPSSGVARQMVRAVNRSEPFVGAAQNAELLSELLPTISAASVSERFKANFDPSKAMFAVTLPAAVAGGVPTEEDVLKAAREALAASVSAETERERPSALMAQTPPQGKIASMAVMPAAEVLSGRLENGGMFHHRFMDYRKNSATVTITLAGGQIEETAATRGFTQAAAVALSRPATRRLSATDIRDIMTGKDVRVSGGAGRDALTISVSGSPADLEIGLQLAHLLLTEPKIEPAAFEQWKQTQLQGIASRKTQPQGVMLEMVPDALYPKDEPRARPLEAAEVQAMTIAPIQEWLDALIARAPFEVSVVGEIDRTAATELVARYFGSLPKRAQMLETTLDEKRRITRASGPIRRDAEVETRTPQAFVYSGFFGVDAENIRDVRTMNLAAQILSTRMIKQVREDAQLVYSIRTISSPAEAYPGFGLFYAASPTDPHKVPALSAKIPEMFAEFAKNGPTDDEVNVARTQVLQTLDEQMKDPSFWTGVLADLTYRSRSLDDVVKAPIFIGAIPKEQIAEIFRKYCTPEAMVSFTVTPRAPASAPTEPQRPAER